MTTEEKLARFSEDAMHMAETLRQAELQEYQKNLDQLYESHTRATRRQSTARLRLTREGLQRERNRLLSRESLEAKRRLSATESDIKDKIFEQVKGMLEAYRQTPDYIQDLLRRIEDAKQQIDGDALCIFVDQQDAPLMDKLAKTSGLPVQITTEPLLGGILAMPLNGTLLVDLSYASALRREFDTMILGGDDHAV